MGAETGVDRIAAIDPEFVDACEWTLAAHLPDGELTVELVRTLDAELAADTVHEPQRGRAPLVVHLPRSGETPLELRVHGLADHGTRGGWPAGLRAAGAVLWLHGGGMMLGSAAGDDALCAALSHDLGVPVITAEYRLSPEHRHPEPLDDCFAALVWLAERADRVVVAGASAGGGLAAGLALLARDRGGPSIAGMQLLYPMLDDRPARRPDDAPVWNARLDALAWSAYLGGRTADEYAAPARATSLAGLSPAYLDVGDADLFLRDDLDFADRLRDAGVPVEVHVHPGAVHAFDWLVPGARTSLLARRQRLAWLRRLLDTDDDRVVDTDLVIDDHPTKGRPTR
ncbi:alpha/beta hydrolase [Herbiconiux moechotypicola]|uniref:Alpha/beta hydrolase fold-3 domain-containing protein n=1 Tax=Herbiconiux moechotypicola TaxID=637393 RepID=A0ABN3DHJ9_9MICO|nr:alpha/beta hydrolase [Herbiconiux moechotypicola]MCS5729642.1 alpha/beta hydrolase [Herbiconiux moechotypicola]